MRLVVYVNVAKMQAWRLVPRRMMKNDLHLVLNVLFERHGMRLCNNTNYRHPGTCGKKPTESKSIRFFFPFMPSTFVYITIRWILLDDNKMPIPNQFKTKDAFAKTTTIAPFSLSLSLLLACSPLLWSLNVGSRVRATKIQRLYISRWLNLYSPLYFKWKRRATYLHSISERHLFFMLILILFSFLLLRSLTNLPCLCMYTIAV